MGRKGGLFIIFLFGIFFNWVFDKAAVAANGGIVINEIMVAGENSSKEEFIELYNPGSVAIDLSGYSLKKRTKSGTESNLVTKGKMLFSIGPGEVFVISHIEYLDFFQAQTSYSGSSYSLANDSTLVLYNNENEVVDLVGFGEASFFESAPAAAPSVGQSISRNSGEDSDNNSSDFIFQSVPSPGKPGLGLPVTFGDEDKTADGAENIGTCSGIKRGDLLINEFVSDPADGDEEWVEIYNPTGKNIDLKDWSITEGSGKRTMLNDSIGTGGQARFIIVSRPKGSLNNLGDMINLVCGSLLVDKVVYGEYDDNSPVNNAPVAGDPYSIARKKDGLDTDNDYMDFVETKKPTKGGANIIINEDLEKEEEDIFTDYSYSQDIVISELLPNPPGEDRLYEFVEIMNCGKEAVDLRGWSISDQSGKVFELDSYLLNPGAIYAIYRNVSNLSLNNSGDTVNLREPKKEISSASIIYNEAPEGESYNLSDCASRKNTWYWSRKPSPGNKNDRDALNRAPDVFFECISQAQVGEPLIFDSSDTSDADDDPLEYRWYFGDGHINSLPFPAHTYLSPGTYTVALAVFDRLAWSTSTKTVSIGTTAGEPFSEKINTDIVISEFTPNPEGQDAEEEWIEVYNRGGTTVNIKNWQIDDSAKGSRAYVFDELELLPGSYHVLSREESGIALNNGYDSVRLLDESEFVIDQVEYSGAKEGFSYARADDNSWYWSPEPTPKGDNLKTNAEPANLFFNLPNTGAEQYLYVPLTDIKDLEGGEKVTCEGVVSVPPGIFGSKYFYIFDQAGVQIYNYNGNFPVMELGMKIMVRGELSYNYGEARIKTASSDDFEILGAGDEPLPKTVNLREIESNLAGILVEVSGEVINKNGANFIISDNEDEAKINVTPNSGIDISGLKKGTLVDVIGIVNLTSSGPRIMPRFDSDFAIRPEVEEQGEVLGDSENVILELPKRKISITYFYPAVLTLAAAALVILIYMLWPLRKK